MTGEIPTDAPSTLVEHVLKTMNEAKAAVVEARKPGRPLDIIATYARQSPLTALALAFLVGVAVARKR